MKKIISACLSQTIRFDRVNDADPRQDFEMFCRILDSKRTKYIIEETKNEPDGTLVVKIKQQYNSYETSGYLQ